jgi:hypothetical protein
MFLWMCFAVTTTVLAARSIWATEALREVCVALQNVIRARLLPFTLGWEKFHSASRFLAACQNSPHETHACVCIACVMAAVRMPI